MGKAAVGARMRGGNDRKTGVGNFFLVVSDFSLDKLEICGIITFRLILKVYT